MLKGFRIRRRGDSNPVPILDRDSFGGGVEYLVLKELDWAFIGLGGGCV